MAEPKTPVLSLLQVEKCIFFDGQKCDFTSSPRPFHVVSTVNRGRAIFKSKYNTITLKEGDVFFIPMGETYRSEWSGGEVVYCTSVFFSFETGKDPTADKSYRLQKIEGETGKSVAELIEKLSKNKGGKKYFDFNAVGDFYALCDAVFGGAPTAQKPVNTSVIQDALDYIDANFDREISVKELAEMCNFSESRFHHVFKELMGMSPIAYKHKVAVNHAQLYLASERNYTVEEVSDKCGFSSSIYFRRVFKKITGKSPREYKRGSML